MPGQIRIGLLPTEFSKLPDLMTQQGGHPRQGIKLGTMLDWRMQIEDSMPPCIAI